MAGRVGLVQRSAFRAISASCFADRPSAVLAAGTSAASLTSASAISVRTPVSSGAVREASSSGAPSPPGALVSDGGNSTSTGRHATSPQAGTGRAVAAAIDAGLVPKGYWHVTATFRDLE